MVFYVHKMKLNGMVSIAAGFSINRAEHGDAPFSLIRMGALCFTIREVFDRNSSNFIRGERTGAR